MKISNVVCTEFDHLNSLIYDFHSNVLILQLCQCKYIFLNLRLFYSLITQSAVS